MLGHHTKLHRIDTWLLKRFIFYSCASIVFPILLRFLSLQGIGSHCIDTVFAKKNYEKFYYIDLKINLFR